MLGITYLNAGRKEEKKERKGASEWDETRTETMP